MSLWGGGGEDLIPVGVGWLCLSLVGHFVLFVEQLEHQCISEQLLSFKTFVKSLWFLEVFLLISADGVSQFKIRFSSHSR